MLLYGVEHCSGPWRCTCRSALPSVGLIFLGLGTAAKLLSPGLEVAILLMVIGTTFLAPVLLRLVLKGKPPEDGNEVPVELAADPLGGAS